MGKYNDHYMTHSELTEITRLIEALVALPLESINIDHIQIGDVNGEILGKIQYNTDARPNWVFMPRKHDKPATLGE